MVKVVFPFKEASELHERASVREGCDLTFRVIDGRNDLHEVTCSKIEDLVWCAITIGVPVTEFFADLIADEVGKAIRKAKGE